MKAHRRYARGTGLLVCALVCGSCRHLPPLQRECLELGPGVRYWHEIQAVPRPLHIHVLQVDLSQSTLALETRIADDPDGAGPAEAELVQPETLATQTIVIAAVNANAFGALPDAKGQRDTHWHEGMPVDIDGWARHAGQDRSGPQAGYGNFWVDREGRAHVGAVVGTNEAMEAAAGFSLLVQGGAMVAGPDVPLHPRTAVGVDKAGRRVWLVVVDGRRKGYSEGVTCHELAGIMQRLGCWDALNLDGGGSSVMMLKQSGGPLGIVNRPSGDTTRPIPVMILLKRKGTP